MSEVHIVVYQQGGQWLAQCLEYDIGAQANCVDDVLYELQRALIGRELAAQRFGIDGVEPLPAAPQRFWDMWKQARITVPAEDEPFRLPHPAFLPKREVRLLA
jgi:hypothetical protein